MQASSAASRAASSIIRRALPALAAAVIALTLSVVTSGSNPGSWDVAENQTVPYILGIAHPTGFPAYTLAGWAFSHALWLGTVAWRLNVFSGLWVSAATGGIVLLAQALGASAIEACLAGLVFILGKQATFQDTHADAHAMLLACMVFALLFAVRYGQHGGRRDLLAASACTGIGLATHPLALFLIPALVLVMTMQPGRARRDVPLALVLVAAPLLLYLYFPLRSAYVAAHGLDPTAAPPLYGAGTVAWDTLHPRTLDGFLAEITGRQYNAAPRLADAFQPTRYGAEIARAWRYFPGELSTATLVLAVFGLIAAGARDLRLLAALVVAPLCTVAFAASFFTDAIDVSRYLLPVFAVVAAVAAAAADAPLPGVPLVVRRIAVVLAMGGSLATAWAVNPAAHGIRDPGAGQAAVDDVRASIPDGAIVVAAWPDATALAYASFVEHSLGTRTVVLGWPHEFRNDYARWARTRRITILANLYGMADLVRSDVPRSWLVQLPSTNPHYVVLQVQPPANAER